MFFMGTDHKSALLSFIGVKLNINMISFKYEKLFLTANLEFISFTAYNNDVDIRIKFQFFSQF